MKNIYYCPKCGKFEIDFDDTKNQNLRTVSNIRDGFGRPICHYLCKCGNPLAGCMNVNGLGDNKEIIEYVKYVVTQYNIGGIFFTDDLLEMANRIVKDRKDGIIKDRSSKNG